MKLSKCVRNKIFQQFKRVVECQNFMSRKFTEAMQLLKTSVNNNRNFCYNLLCNQFRLMKEDSGSKDRSTRIHHISEDNKASGK